MTEKFTDTDIPMSPRVADARDFATQAHRGQKRSFSDDDYIVHPLAVRRTIANHFRDHPDRELMEIVAILHDTIEDTEVRKAEIEARYGRRAADLVDQLSNVSKLSDGVRAVRVAIDIAHLAKADILAKNVRLADILDNVTGLSVKNPGFGRKYLPEKKRALAVLQDADSRLLDRVARTIEFEMEAIENRNRPRTEISSRPGP